MKGQLTIEYMITFVGFIGFIIFIYFQYSSNIPSFITEINKENTRSKAYQLSELLLNDPGHPSNWGEPTVSVERIGLSYEAENKTNLLSLDKIEDLDDLCSNYLDVQEKIAFDRPFSLHFYSIAGDGVRGNDLLEHCTPPSALVEKTELNVTIRRVTSFYDDTGGTINLGELIIEV